MSPDVPLDLPRPSVPTVLGPDASGRYVVVDSGRVSTVQRERPHLDDARTLDCSGAIIEPGDVNAHTHLYSGLAPLGMPQPEVPPESFVEILERVWWRLDRALDARTLRASARYALAQALLHGTTTLVDHHESPAFIDGSLDVLSEAANDLGARLALTFGATERNGGHEEAQAGLRECARWLVAHRKRGEGSGELEAARSETLRGLIGLHASFTVSDETIREAGDLCREYDVPLHVHVAEARSDVEDAQSRGYEDPFDRLIKLDAIVPNSILAHGIHLDAEAVEQTDARTCWIVQNPRSNEGNDVGYPKTIHRSDRLALGTDGYLSDMREEATHLRRLAASHQDPGDLERRTSGGRRLAAALFGASFELVPGAVADLVVRDLDGSVRHVLVAGECVVENGRLARCEFEAIEAEATGAAAELWAAMRSL